MCGSFKGGVGKTASSWNLAYSLAEMGKRVLAVERVIPLGWEYIRGYAAPRYEKAVNGTGGNPGIGKKSVETVAKEVLAGKWGNGEDRKKRLQAAGYDYPSV